MSNWKEKLTTMDCRTQLTQLAFGELDKGDYLMATKILTTGIRLDPNNHELYFERSICHHKIGNYQASLDDADAAIRLNPEDYKVHYQKGLALTGLLLKKEALIPFKKAIELCAKQDDSKLSDIWKLVREAALELDLCVRRLGVSNHQPTLSETVPIPANHQANPILAHGQGTSNDPVDSTTDRPILYNQPGTSGNHQNITPVENNKKHGNNTLVAVSNRNNQPPISNSAQAMSGNVGTLGGTNRVSSSASHINNRHMPIINVSPDISGLKIDTQNLGNDLLSQNHQSNEHGDSSKTSQFDWNIRRSERIFFHHSEPGSSRPQYGILARPGEPHETLNHNQKQRTGSNPSSINSGSRGGATKRSNSGGDQQQSYQQPNKLARSKEGTNSHAESDIDVDDSYNPQQAAPSPNVNELNKNSKRVMIAPSSSMPATSQGPSTSGSKDDSYSSKYKRLRRDRERARRGTSKLCTIKPSDLEELQRPTNSDSGKRFMRVIAPIDGWLYSGQLSVDENSSNANGTSQYIVKLDGDSTGNIFLFSSETVLNDVIKEVRVKSVSDLRKGARICCYWSRQYKCLSTGVVTSRTFEATKSLVSVKYDNGDLSALPLEDLRLLPPDYPKYMSNCDPLLLARNGDGPQVASTVSSNNNINQSGNRIIVESNPTHTQLRASNETPPPVAESGGEVGEVQVESISLTEKSEPALDETMIVQSEETQHKDEVEFDEERRNHGHFEDDDEDSTIPPTDEIIDFITSEITLKEHDKNHHDVDRVPNTKDNITITETQLTTNTSRASSEENNYGIEYCPWTFEGPPRRSKRHGRTYRDNYSAIRRGNEVIKVGDSAELMPRDESILPFIAKIEGFWATGRGEMRVRVRWYYRLIETEGEPYDLKDGENALFETDHFDENDVQSIYRATRILSWTDYNGNSLGHVNKNNDNTPKIFYLAGYYDPVRRIKHLRSDVKEGQ